MLVINKTGAILPIDDLGEELPIDGTLELIEFTALEREALLPLLNNGSLAYVIDGVESTPEQTVEIAEKQTQGVDLSDYLKADAIVSHVSQAVEGARLIVNGDPTQFTVPVISIDGQSQYIWVEGSTVVKPQPEPIYSATNSHGSLSDQRLFDEDLNNQWWNNGQDKFDIIVDYGEGFAFVMDSYEIHQHSYSHYPTKWRFEGSHDGSNWAKLHDKRNMVLNDTSNEYVFNVASSTPYRFFRLKVQKCRNKWANLNEFVFNRVL